MEREMRLHFFCFPQILMLDFGDWTLAMAKEKRGKSKTGINHLLII